MPSAARVKYSEIAKVQIKLSLRTNLFIALLITAITPVIFGVNNLDAVASAFVLERFVSLVGIVLLTPIFLPEQDKNIAELTESKYTPPAAVNMIRLILAVVSLLLLIGGFITVMVLMSCVFDVPKFIFGTFTTAFFLGALGFTVYAVSDNMIAGYLLPLGFYMFSMFSGNKLKYIYLFSMAKNSFSEKYWLFGIGIALIIAAMIYKQIQIKLR